MERIRDRKTLLFNSIIELENKIDLCSWEEYEFKSLLVEYKELMNTYFDVLQETGNTQYIEYHKHINGYVDSNDFKKVKKELKSDLSQVKGGLSIS